MKSFYSVMKKANEIDQELKRLLKENKDFRKEYANLNASGGSGSDVEALMKRYGAKMNTQAKGRSSSGYGGGGFRYDWSDFDNDWKKYQDRQEESKYERDLDKGLRAGAAAAGLASAAKEILYDGDTTFQEDLGLLLGTLGATYGGTFGARRGKPFSFGRSLAGSLAGGIPGYGYAFYSINQRNKKKSKGRKRNSSVKKANEDKNKEYGLKELGTSVGTFLGGNILGSEASLFLANKAKKLLQKDGFFDSFVPKDWERMQDILKKVYKGKAKVVGSDGNSYQAFYDDERGNFVGDGGRIKANSTASLLHEIGHAKNYDSLGKLKIPAALTRGLTQLSLNNPLTYIISNVGGNLDPDGEHSGKVMAANALLASPALLDEGAASIRSVFDRAKLDKKGLWDAAKKQRSMLPAFGTHALALASPTLNYYFGRLAGKINNGREETTTE